MTPAVSVLMPCYNNCLVARYPIQYSFQHIDQTQLLDKKTDYIVLYQHNVASRKDYKTKTQAIALLFNKLGLLPFYKKFKTIDKKINR